MPIQTPPRQIAAFDDWPGAATVPFSGSLARAPERRSFGSSVLLTRKDGSDDQQTHGAGAR
jgi:hypothetical protein